MVSRLIVGRAMVSRVTVSGAIASRAMVSRAMVSRAIVGRAIVSKRLHVDPLVAAVAARRAQPPHKLPCLHHLHGVYAW